MLRRIVVLLFLALSACAAPAAPSPAGTPPPTVPALPSQPPVGATVLASDRGQTPGAPNAATEPSAQASPLITAVPVTSVPASTPIAAGFDFALRPEFARDLNHILFKTVYTMNWELNDDLSELHGTQRVIFANNTGKSISEIYFRLFANFPGGEGSIDVTRVQISGRGAETRLEAQDTALRVSLGRPIGTGRTIILQLEYDVKIPSTASVRYSDFITTSWVTTLPTIYPIIPAYDAQGWHLEVPPAYGDLVYADSSVYDVTITTPARYNVIASGQLVQELAEDGKVSRRFIAAPMRDFDANITSTLVSTTATLDDITIRSWYDPAHADAGKRALDWTVEAMRVYQKRIGPYPFKELDLVETPTTAGGIEYPGVITVATGLYTDPGQLNFFEFATAHEAAHQWFYSTVGNDQINHPWMDEALAQYVTLTYFEERYGKETARGIQENYFDKQYETAKARYGDRPAGLPVGAYDEDAYGAFIYSKGPKFFQAIRDRIGDEAFFKSLQTYYERFKYRNARPSDMLGVFNEISGEDLTPLYEKWIGS